MLKLRNVVYVDKTRQHFSVRAYAACDFVNDATLWNELNTIYTTIVRKQGSVLLSLIYLTRVNASNI